MRRQPGDVILRTRRGVEVRYSPSQGSSTRYRVVCPHGRGVNARTQDDAREDAALVDEWCVECAVDRDEQVAASIARQLAEAGRAQRDAERAWRDATGELHRLVVDADRRGWSKVRIARAAGIARQTVFRILKEARS